MPTTKKKSRPTSGAVPNIQIQKLANDDKQTSEITLPNISHSKTNQHFNTKQRKRSRASKQSSSVKYISNQSYSDSDFDKYELQEDVEHDALPAKKRGKNSRSSKRGGGTNITINFTQPTNNIPLPPKK